MLILKIKIVGWSCQIAIDDTATFAELHHMIQDAVEFDDDHLYEFYLARSERSRNRVTVSSYEDADLITLGSVFPIGVGEKLFYLFDYGDNWVFQILPSKKKPLLPDKGNACPTLLSETGEKPEQYPDWEE